MEQYNVKQLVLAGADLLEQNPERYNFWNNSVSKIAPQCILGFIGEVGNFPIGSNVFTVARTLGLDSDNKDILNYIEHRAVDRCGVDIDKMPASAAASLMREFAETLQ